MRKYVPRKLGDHSITRSADLADFIVALRRTPHPVIVSIRDHKYYIRVLLHSCYTAITPKPSGKPLGFCGGHFSSTCRSHETLAGVGLLGHRENMGLPEF